LITPQDVTPSRAGLEVVGAFNAGVAVYQGEVILLMRVSERLAHQEAGYQLCPYIDPEGALQTVRVKLDDPAWDTSDPRKFQHKATGEVYLTSISHLRLARSSDGNRFTVGPSPWLAPATQYESFGVEDCRITKIGDTYYVNYSAVSRYGVATALASTQDFVAFERHGLIFPPANRNVSIFPEQVSGQYVCYHRPMPGMFGSFNIWIARSPDLLHWGGHELVINAQPDGWQSGRVGSGAPPIKTDRGWLSIYHAADREDFYSLGAFLTPLDNPAYITYQSKSPVLSPEASYETDGFFGNVVFTCGAVERDGIISVYYGAADDSIALAQYPLADLVDWLCAER
jgi:predicted GH43/DUF377 family glycosyl hydrolase